MTKRIQAKYKIDRRMGENIWGRPKSPINLRSYGPGQHGQGRKSKLSDFGLQMRAKQKLKGYYGNIGEKQFRKYFSEAERRKALVKRWYDPGYTDAGFPQPESFWIFLKIENDVVLPQQRLYQIYYPSELKLGQLLSK